MNLWKTLGLLAVFGLLLAWSLVKERGDAPDENADRQIVQLLGFKEAKEIKEISVTSPEGSFSLERAPKPAKKAKKDKADKSPAEPASDGWKITNPLKGEADKAGAETYVKTLLTAKAVNFYKEEQAKNVSATDTGLDKPLTTLTVKNEGGRQATLNVGKKTPDNNGYYAQVAGHKSLFIFATFMVDENIAFKKLNDLRDKQLVALAANDVQGLTLKYPDKQLRLTRDKSVWTLEADGKKFAADTNTVDNLISSVSTARVDKFLEAKPTNLTTYGLDKPRIELTVDLGAGKAPVGLVLGSTHGEAAKPNPMNPQQPPKNDQKVYVQRKGETEVVDVADSLYKALLKTPEELRDKVVLAFDSTKATKLEYTVEGKDVVLEKAPAKGAKDNTPVWQLRKPADTLADSRKADAMVSNLKSLQALQFVDEPAALSTYGLDQPAGKFTVTERDGKPVTLLVGAETSDKGGRWAVREGGKVVMKVRAGFLKDMETSANRLRDLMVAKLDRTKITEIAIRRKGQDLVVLHKKSDTDWTVQTQGEKPKDDKSKKSDADDKNKPKDYTKPQKADAGKVGIVLSALEEVRADEWMTDDKAADLGKYGLKAEDADIIATVTTSDGKKTTLYVCHDPKGSLAAFVKLKDATTIFKSDHGMLLSDLAKSAQEFEPSPEPPPGMPMGMPGGGMGGPPPGEEPPPMN